jgi:predicted dehydrogenase
MPADERVGLAVIGLGRHGVRYADHIVQDVPNATLVAVSRRDEVKGRADADRLGCRYYREVDDLLADPHVDGVVVATPTDSHAPITVASAKAGKHVLCEKPMGRSLDECRQMRDAALAAGVKLAVGQTLRYTPLIQTMRERLVDLGELYGLHACMRQEKAVHGWHLDREVAGGGAVIEVGVHLFDTLRYLTGGNIQRAMAHQRDTYNAGVETYASGLLWLDGGLTSAVDVAKCVEGRLTRFEAVGAEGQIIANLTTNSLLRVHGRRVSPLDAPENAATLPPLVRDFCHAILHGHDVPISAEDGMHALSVCEAFYRSAGTGLPADVRL